MELVACGSSSDDGRVHPVLVVEGSLAVLLEERGHVVVVSVIQGPTFQNLQHARVTLTCC